MPIDGTPIPNPPLVSTSFDSEGNRVPLLAASQIEDVAPGAEPNVGEEFTATEKTKLAGVEDGATADSGITLPQRHDLNSVPGLIAKTADLQVEVTARAWGDVADLALGGFVSESSGNLGPVHAAGLVYVLSKTATEADANNGYVYIGIPSDRDSRDYRIRQDGSLGEFFIDSWDHVGLHENFEYYRSRHNLFESYDVTIQYDEVTATQTHFRGDSLAAKSLVESAGFDGKLAPTDDTVQKVAQKLDDLDTSTHQLDASEANDGASDVFGEISGELVAGAIDAHHTTQHTWLTELRLDFREPQASTEPQFHVLIVGGQTTHDRILEFSQLNDADADFIRSIVAETVVNVHGSSFTVFAFMASGTDLWLQGEFNADPVLVDEENYRLRFTAPRPNDAVDISVDTSNLDGKLAGTAANLQAMLETIDDFIFAAGLGGNPAWTDVQGRPNRPNAAELLGGISTDEAVASVSDIVALINNHRRTLSNEDPENVGNVAEEGDGGTVSRHNHRHRFPHNNTIQYDPTAENFGINMHDVTEHTGHTIRYFTNEDTFTNGGGLSEGQIYTTSRFRKLITKVQLQTSNLLGAHFRVRIKTVDGDRNITGDLGRSYAVNPGSTNPHSYPFYDADGEVGIVEAGNQRIAIILEGDEAGDTPALRYGDQEIDSPGESYPDASVDFHLENDVVYADRDPAIGQHSHSHGNRIRGNIKIFYQLIYGHDDLESEIEPSDAVPQPNTTDGSAGDSDDYSRANHAHPGTAGGGEPAALAGQTVETLFDNRADTEAAITVNAGTGSALLSADVALSRAIVEADDDQDLRSRFVYTQDGQIRSFDVTMNAGIFRNFAANNTGVGSIAPTEGYHIFSVVDGRSNRTLTSLFGRAALLVRGTIATGDVVRIYLNTTSNPAVAITEMRGVVELIPRIDALTISGGSGGGGARAAGASIIGSHSQIVLWRYNSIKPADPPDPYNVDDNTFAAHYGSWNLSESAALALRSSASDPLWVAYGGTDNVAPDSIVNRAWSVFAVAGHRYSGDNGVTGHSIRQDTDTSYQFWRPDGSRSPWLALADIPDGFIELIHRSPAFSTHDTSVRYEAVGGVGINGDNFSQLAVTMEAYGSTDSDGNPTAFGVSDTIYIQKTGDTWSEFDTNADRDLQGTGTIKLRLDDVVGGSSARYGSDSTSDDQDDNIHAVPDFPERRMSMNLNIITHPDDHDHLIGFAFHHFKSQFAKCLVTVGIR